MHHVHKLKKVDENGPALASKALDELMISRLTTDAKEEWLERAGMLRIWITISVEKAPLNVDVLKKLLDDLYEIVGKPFSAAAAHAAQTVSRQVSAVRNL